MKLLRVFLFIATFLFGSTLFSYETCVIEEIIKETDYLFDQNEKEDAIEVIDAAIQNCSLESIYLARLLNERGGLLRHLNRIDESKKDHLRAIELAKENYEENILEIANIYMRLASTYSAEGNFNEAINLLRESIELYESNDMDNEWLTYSYSHIAQNLSNRGNYKEANKYYSIAEDHAKRIHGTDSEEYSIALNSKGVNFSKQGRYEEAEKLHRKALDILEIFPLGQQVNISITANNLATVLTDQGKYKEAEMFFNNAIETIKSYQSGDSINLAVFIYNLAFNYRYQFRLLESHGLLIEAAEIVSRVLPADHPSVGITKQGVYMVLKEQGRMQEAIELNKEIYEIFKASFDPDSNRMADIYSNLAVDAIYLKNLVQSDNFFKETIRINSINRGENAPRLAASYGEYANFLDTQEVFVKAEEFHLKAIDILIKDPKKNPAQIITRLNNLTYHYLLRNNTKKALEYSNIAERLIIELENVDLGNLPSLTYSSISKAKYLDRELATSLQYAKRSNSAFREYLERNEIKDTRVLVKEYKNQTVAYENHLNLLTEMYEENNNPINKNQAFKISQLASISPVAFAINRQSSREKAGRNSSTVRRYQDFIEERRLLQRKINNLLINHDIENFDKELKRLGRNKKSLDLLINRIGKQIDRTLSSNYSSIIIPKGFSIKEVQRMIKEDSLIIKFKVLENKVLVWALTKEDDHFYSVDLSREDLKQTIEIIRKTNLDYDKKLDSYPFDKSLYLYKELLFPSLDRFKKPTQIVLIPDESLHLLSFSSLATKEVKYSKNKELPWLIRNYAISILPSISSLAYLDTNLEKASFDSFVGVGDPELRGKKDNASLIVRRGAGLDYEEVKSLPRLEESKLELELISKLFKPQEVQLLTGVMAEKINIRSLDLREVSLLVFATHAVNANLGFDLEESSLVISGIGSKDINDWLLTSSEIRELDIGADLVILSACNTASISSGGQSAYSGLAESFFYAGANSVLVSQWPVDSYSTVELTTNMLLNFKENNSLTMSQALQRSMLSLMQSNDTYQHPFYWAPFVLVGAN